MGLWASETCVEGICGVEVAGTLQKLVLYNINNANNRLHYSQQREQT